MSTSAPRHEVVCDTTPVRHFALVGQVDLLARTLNGVIRVPRQVLNPDEDTGGPEAVLSEIGESERYWRGRSSSPDGMENWSRLAALRQRADIEVLDLDEPELVVYAQLISPEHARSIGLAAPFGRGEAAVMALAEGRDFGAAVDDRAAREELSRRSPGTTVMTSREVLRRAVSRELVTSAEAQIIYLDFLEKGYRGPPDLW